MLNLTGKFTENMNTRYYNNLGVLKGFSYCLAYAGDSPFMIVYGGFTVTFDAALEINIYNNAINPPRYVRFYYDVLGEAEVGNYYTVREWGERYKTSPSIVMQWVLMFSDPGFDLALDSERGVDARVLYKWGLTND